MYISSVFLSLCIKEAPGTYTVSSEKISSSSIPVVIFFTNNLSKASEVSDLMIQFFKNVKPPIRTSSFAAIKVFQSGFSKLSLMSILKSSAFSLVWL